MNPGTHQKLGKNQSPFHPIEAMADLRREFGEHGGVNMSVEASTTFSVMSAQTLPSIFLGQLGPKEGGCYLYGRHFNPTVYNLGRQLAQMEGAEASYCTASGLGAISSVLFQLCNQGDEIVSSRAIYGGTFALMNDYLPLKGGIKTHFVDICDLEDVERAITKRTKLLYLETMSNPSLGVADIPALAALAKKHGIKLVVDNTFTPLIISPIKLGADVVVHSLTKYINGASDIIAGAICGSAQFIESMMDLHTGSLMLLGPTLDPHSASAISLRLPHLSMRMKEHSHRAMNFAKRVQGMGFSVIYPGLKDYPQREVFDRIRNTEFGCGGILCIDMGTYERANDLLNALQNDEGFGIIAVSLGYFETLMTCPAATTSSELSEASMREAGISPGLVRLSIGYSGSVEQRWTQLERALKKVRGQE